MNAYVMNWNKLFQIEIELTRQFLFFNTDWILLSSSFCRTALNLTLRYQWFCEKLHNHIFFSQHTSHVTLHHGFVPPQFTKKQKQAQFSNRIFWVYSTTFHRTWVRMPSKLGFVRKSYIVAWSVSCCLSTFHQFL